jgi:hypothetical protein
MNMTQHDLLAEDRMREDPKQGRQQCCTVLNMSHVVKEETVRQRLAQLDTVLIRVLLGEIRARRAHWLGRVQPCGPSGNVAYSLSNLISPPRTMQGWQQGWQFDRRYGYLSCR